MSRRLKLIVGLIVKHIISAAFFSRESRRSLAGFIQIDFTSAVTPHQDAEADEVYGRILNSNKTCLDVLTAVSLQKFIIRLCDETRRFAVVNRRVIKRLNT